MSHFGVFFFFSPLYESLVIWFFWIPFNLCCPKRVNLVFFHHIHSWAVSDRKAAVVPEQLALGQSGGPCLIRQTIRMQSAQQSLVMGSGAKSHCLVSILTGAYWCCTDKPAEFTEDAWLSVKSPLKHPGVSVRSEHHCCSNQASGQLTAKAPLCSGFIYFPDL